MHRFGRLLALSAAIALVIGAPAEAQNAKCTRESGPAPAAGTALSSPVTLTPDREAEVINFGAGRGTQERDILITASKPLPKSVTPRQIGLDVPRRFERVGTTRWRAFRCWLPDSQSPRSARIAGRFASRPVLMGTA